MLIGVIGAAVALGAAATIQPAKVEAEGEGAGRAFAAAAAALAIALAEEESAFGDAEENSIDIPLAALAPWIAAPKTPGAPDLEIGGLGVSFAAYKPKLRHDAFGAEGFRSESRAMGKAMPGYPQPARLVVGVKVSF